MVSLITFLTLCFFSSVIRRLMTLLAVQATLNATSEAALRQAASASKAAEDLMSSKKEKASSDIDSKELEEALTKLKQELAEARKGTSFSSSSNLLITPLDLTTERSQALKDLDAFKTQSEGVAREYDRLLEEHGKLEKKLAKLEGENSSDKKDD